MYTLKGIFPEPKKDQKNFIKQNKLQVKSMQSGPGTGQSRAAPRLCRGDVAEFVRKKERRAVTTTQLRPLLEKVKESAPATVKVEHDSGGTSRDAGSQTEQERESPEEPERSRLHHILHRDLPTGSGTTGNLKPKGTHRNTVLGTDRLASQGTVLGTGRDSVECPPGHVQLPEEERRETLRMLKQSFSELVSELNRIPVRSDSLRSRARKEHIESRLSTLEDGIRVFSRPHVFVQLNT